MAVVVVLIYLAFALSTAMSGQTCLQCPSVRSHTECTYSVQCPHDQVCSTTVFNSKDGIHFSFQCSRKDMCMTKFNTQFNMIGRKRMLLATSDLSLDYKREVCMDCCHNKEHCNRDLCEVWQKYTGPSGTPIPTIDIPTTAGCQDHEEDGLRCTILGLAGLCTDKSRLAVKLASTKCPKFCNICKPASNTSAVLVNPPPGDVCANFEQDGTRCADLDQYNTCSVVSSLTYILAHEKCRLHCGLCQTTTTTTTTTQTSPTTTTSVTTTTTPVSSSPTSPTTTTTPVFTATGTTTLHTTKLTDTCVDKEDATFNCTEWASHGYCLPFPGIGYETAKIRCRKHCGFCPTTTITTPTPVTTVPMPTGPLTCLNCYSVLDHDSCNTNLTCKDGQVCAANVARFNGVKLYNFICQDHTTCKAGHTNSRSMEARALPELLCNECCYSSGCNKNLCTI